MAFPSIRSLLILSACVASLVSPSPAFARLSRLHIDRTEIIDLPSFGATGAYQAISGTFEGELDPGNPRNSVIADLALAPRVDGKVRYASTFYILRPLDPAKGNGKLFYMFGNRGRKIELRLNDAHDSNDPRTSGDFGNGWLNQKGYILAWSGWDGSVVPGPDLLDIRLPVARNPDGSSIVGAVTAELTPFTAGAKVIDLPYASARADSSNGTLTMREHEADPKVALPGWHYVDDRHVALPEDGRVQWIYEFVYTAKDPAIMGIGHAATRDFIAFLRFAAKDEAGTPNPVAMPAGLKAVYSFGRSQGGRVQRDFLYWGFNEDETVAHRMLIDGMMPYATGSSLMWMNDRFAQPTVTVLQHSRHHARGTEPPHAMPVLTDPVAGVTDGVLRRCREREVCPKVMMVEGGNEYWNKTTSLNHTDASGKDLDLEKLAPEVRLYSVASIQHSAFRGDRPDRTDFCQGFTNPLYQGQLFRALIVALDGWVDRGAAPPESRFAKRGDGTLVSPDSVAFPHIPGVEFSPGSMGRIAAADASGADMPGKGYTALVPQVDADGNDLAGVRMPFLAVPLGTHTGWSLLKPGMGGPDLCGQYGQFVPFAKTKADRLAADDPRPSLEERYPTLGVYEARLRQAIDGMTRQRLLLQEDGRSLFDEGVSLAVSAGVQSKPAPASPAKD